MTLEKSWTEDTRLHKIANIPHPKNTKGPAKGKGKTRKNRST